MLNRKFWNAGLLILVCAVLLVGLQRYQQTVRESEAVDPVAAADKQLAALHAMGAAVAADPFQMTVKWQGAWITQLSPEEAAGALASRLGLPSPQRSFVQGHAVYGAKGRIGGLPVNLAVTAEDKGKYYVVLRMESVGGQPELLGTITEIQQQTGESLADEGVQIGWNAAVQGIAWPATAVMNSADFGEKHALSMTLDNLEKKIERLPELKLKRVEGFADDLSISQTYSVSGLTLTAMSGEHPVALQLAVHRNTGTGMDEIAIGSPLLTIEY